MKVFLPYGIYFLATNYYMAVFLMEGPGDLDPDSAKGKFELLLRHIVFLGVFYFGAIEIVQFLSSPIAYLGDGFNYFEVFSLYANFSLMYYHIYQEG